MAVVLLDIDGVLQVSGAAIPGAPEAVRKLRADGHRLRLVTNNTIRSRAGLAAELRSLGFDVDAAEIETTPLAAAHALAGSRVLALTAAAIHEDLAGRVTLVERDADAVLVGGAEETDESARIYAYDTLNRAFAELQRNARLVALHTNRWWQTAAGPQLDGGAFVAALEYAAGVEATVAGKPSPALFTAALAAIPGRGRALMVGDDIEGDIGGALDAELEAILVRTGKYRPDAVAASGIEPTATIDSIADLPGLLGS